MTRVLKLPAYRRLLSAYTLNELGWSFGSLSLAVLVYRRTGSAAGATAFFLSAQFLPALVSPLIVARLDQRSVRAVLPAIYACEALAFLGLAGVASSFSLAAVLALALIDGLLALSARAIARASAVAVTAPAGLLREGNALANMSFSVSFMVGPALGGVVVAAGGIGTALLINSGVFAIVALILATAHGLPVAVHEPGPTAGRLRAALAHARELPRVRALLALQAAALLFFTVSIPVEIVLAQHSLHAGARGYGALLGCWGVGAVAGSAIYVRWRGLASRVLIAASATALAVGFVTMAASPTLVVALAGAAIGGAGNGVEAVAARSALQELLEQRWMAMIMSLNESIFQAVPGAGILIGGAVTVLWSPRAALALGGGGALLVAGIAWRVLRPDEDTETDVGFNEVPDPDVPGPKAAEPVGRQ